MIKYGHHENGEYVTQFYQEINDTSSPFTAVYNGIENGSNTWLASVR